jgi:hypothetical protein
MSLQLSAPIPLAATHILDDFACGKKTPATRKERTVVGLVLLFIERDVQITPDALFAHFHPGNERFQVPDDHATDFRWEFVEFDGFRVFIASEHNGAMASSKPHPRGVTILVHVEGGACIQVARVALWRAPALNRPIRRNQNRTAYPDEAAVLGEPVEEPSSTSRALKVQSDNKLRHNEERSVIGLVG